MRVIHMVLFWVVTFAYDGDNDDDEKDNDVNANINTEKQ